jgi:hypothetical protein
MNLKERRGIKDAGVTQKVGEALLVVFVRFIFISTFFFFNN